MTGPVRRYAWAARIPVEGSNYAVVVGHGEVGVGPGAAVQVDAIVAGALCAV